MRFILAIVLLQFGNPAFSQAGWYLKVDGVLWNSSSTVPNNAKLIFGLKEGTNMTPCYNLTTAKLKHNGVVLAQPTGLKNPWNINLATILNGKTGMISIEIGGKGCTNSNTQSWVINVNTTASVPAGTTAATSMLKNMPRTQHVVAKIVFANTSAVVNSICFVTGYPKSNNYQTVSNAKVNTGVLKSVPTGYNYLEYKFNNVAKGAQAV